MIRQMQRMDDGQQSTAGVGAGTGPRLLPPITVLADACESEAEALEEWARGLDWVRWLFSSVRQRMPYLYFAAPASVEAASGIETHIASNRNHEGSLFRPPSIVLWGAWECFIKETFMPVLGPRLIRAWQAAQAGDLATLLALDEELDNELPQEVLQRSVKAGALLLRSTERARYQGILHRYRKLHDESVTAGHFLIAWAAVGNFFQLSLANVAAEYLRLDWVMAAREFEGTAEPDGFFAISDVTSRLMTNSGSFLQLMRATEPETDVGTKAETKSGG